MKATEAIKQLQEFVDMFGDRQLVVEAHIPNCETFISSMESMRRTTPKGFDKEVIMLDWR